MSQHEITVFTEGDSADSRVWSNVPFFLTNTLEDKGYKVNRVNLSGNHFLRIFYDKFLCRILRHSILKGTSFSYNRSLCYTAQIKHALKKAVKQYPDTDFFISTSFSFSPSNFTNKPCILFCDWTYEYYIHHFLNKKDDFLEKAEVKRQTAIIEQATAVFSLFPDKAAHMKQIYHNPHIYYLGNVINSPVYKRGDNTYYDRFKEKHILFIGLKKYIAGAESLINAVSLLQKEGLSIQLDIIGMNEKDFSRVLPDYIHCHGYLDKNTVESSKKYYSLINHASVYVNTTPLWAGFSSCLEVMYHYVPVVTTPYLSFTETFGNTIDFGYLCSENEPALIVKYLMDLFSLSPENYQVLCENARKASEPYTWSNYVDNMMKVIKTKK